MIATQTKLPVFVITHEFFPKRGGIATFSEEIARASTRMGYPVEVWAPHQSFQEDKVWPFKVERVSLRGTQDFACQVRMARQMIRQRRRLRKGIVYLPEPGPVLAMTYLHHFKAFKPARMVLTFHGTEILKFASRPGSKLLVNQLIKKADRVTTPSAYTQNLLHTHFPFSIQKSVITPCALRTDFEPTPRTGPKASSKVIVVTVGRLHPRKGQRYVIDALNDLPESLRAKTEYWIVGRGGRGNYEALLRTMADEARFPVHFFGGLDDEQLRTIYQHADIFAMTSVNHNFSVEGFGQVYLEASAFGLPVVAHTVGGVPEAVSNGETGLLVAPGDKQALTAAFARLIEDADFRHRLGRNGPGWARKNTWENAVHRIFEFDDRLTAAS